MKTRALIVVAAVSVGLTLSGCDQVRRLAGGGKAEGQVVATVDGQEITSLELRTELGNFASRDPNVMKAAQQQALQRIIMRKLMAAEAREQKLDKSAEYNLQVARGEEALLGSLLQRKMASKAAQPTKAQAQAYVAAHPEKFGERKVMFVDQIIAAPNKISPDRFQPLKTMDEVKALLNSEGVQYQENAVVLDTLSANPRLVQGVNNLPPGEIFVIPQGGAILFNRVTASRAVPFGGDASVAYAMNALRQERAQELVGKQLADMRKAAEPKITYNAAFKPPPEKKPGAAPAAKPAAAPAAPAPAAPAAEPAAK
ncbi:MAG: SurA N-terminal domain-containing protein [Phenylobacterium sp.]|uniref:SurA N-terminal domain-containing protein n=1 Tax=Phenylobacterium sp. TaxID=1871053 RepID=UPI001A61368A|nr:SurA N-terminal domain-containing protein [Phenylobacterium sp.]MBL8770962.1 SurA N-terminal domain-containing protein [Phenylobacterium sp.]